MPKPTLPAPTDSENLCFHPVFAWAVNEALRRKKLNVDFHLKPQFQTPSGPADFAIVRTATGKVLFPIEIKRSKTSVRGPGRRQARDYQANLGTQQETAYYCASNLELTEFFRVDAGRPQTSAQRLSLHHGSSGELGKTSDSDFYNALVECVLEILSIALGEAPYEYTDGLTQFQGHVGAHLDDADSWHQLFVPLCFEYVRGAATQIASLHAQTKDWKTARSYCKTPQRLNTLGGKIDFAHIFREPAPEPYCTEAFADGVLREAHNAGKAQGNGDDIAELVNELLAPSGPGIVQTDTELAQLLAIIARDALGRDLASDEKVCDPGAGSGRLLTALSTLAFPDLQARQVYAIEKEQRFGEPLSLRLGLAFAGQLTKENAPSIVMAPLESLPDDALAAVRVVVMNPPYLSGVQAGVEKACFSIRIEKLLKEPALLDRGQIAFEALFLELVWHLAAPGTVIAVVFPSQHLVRLSDEVVHLRQFLAKNLALTHIVQYPSEDLFDAVIKQTVLLAGVKGEQGNTIKLIDVQKRVADIDLMELHYGLQRDSDSPSHGVTIRQLARSDLLTASKHGWRQFLGAGARATNFINQHMQGFSTVESLGKHVRRGTIASSGNKALTVFSKIAPTHPEITTRIPDTWLRAVLNTTEAMPRVLTVANAPEISFLPPQEAYDTEHPDHSCLVGIVEAHLSIHRPRAGHQARAVKTAANIIADLKSDQKDLGNNWVLIPRGARVRGQVGLLEEAGVLLSTNVAMVRFERHQERRLFASWMLSVFGQLQLELHGVSQEGMRKLEMGQIRKVHYPNLASLPQALADRLVALIETEAPCEFASFSARETDRLWANAIDAANPETCLENAIELFNALIDERRSQGS